MNENYIRTKEEYYNEFSKEQKEEALKIALDVRKFEIELYWKRATYFWAFITTFFAGYTYVLTTDIRLKPLALVGVAFIGLIFSWGWYLVNRGSKYWQENWEAHVSILTREVKNPIFNLIISSKNSFYCYNKSYPFSVSKVNQLLSLVVCAGWFGMCIYSLALLAIDFKKYYSCSNSKGIVCLILVVGIILFLVVLLFTIVWFTRKARSGHFSRHEINADLLFKKI